MTDPGREDGGDGRRARVLCVGTPTLALELRDLLATWLPTVEVVREPAGAVRAVPEVACVVAGPEPTGEAALHLLRELRAGGYANGVVLLAAPGSVDGAAHEAAQLGATLCEPEPGGTGEPLAAAVAGQLARADGGSADDEVRRTRQQLAAGALALRLQHSLNNPLAALLAEAQLLELEELAPEHRAAVRRIIELCRRTAGVVRELSAVRPPVPAAGNEAARGR